MDIPALAVVGISKRFGALEAVKPLTFEVRRGEVFGLLGPNGAGKTTAIRMIAGLLAADAGEVRLDGARFTMSADDRVRVGLCPQELVVWDRLTCLEQLRFMGQMCGMRTREATARGAALLGELGLTPKADALAGTLSGGMKRRLNLALALVHDPQLVILDEPEAGLDAHSRVLVRDFVRSLAGRRTVLLTTHDMEEADRLADRVAIIDHGQLLVCDRPSSLKERLGASLGDVLEVRLGHGVDAAAAARALEGLPAAVVQPRDGLLGVRTKQGASLLPHVLERLKAGGVAVEEARVRAPTLEDVFLELTGRRLRE